MRYLITLILVAFALTTNARQISGEEAKAIASEVLNASASSVNQKPVKVKRVKMSSDKSEDTDSAPYYIFSGENQQGFAIISGDDRAPRIIGYSDKGTFDLNNVPPQLKAILDGYAGHIQNLSTSDTHLSWKTSAQSGKEILLETANWDQVGPYNQFMPEIDGVKAPAGCVATAMAIVMKYNCWPSTYDWNSMPTENLNESNSAQIARLMKDAGEAVHMQYGAAESSANMNWVGHRFYHDFNYSSECQFITRQNFSEEEWESIILDNLSDGHPLIYTGSGSGSHAFVLDGVREGMYHINWGWSGQFNGYFALDALVLDNGQNFGEHCGMVINIYPGDSSRKYSEVMADYGYFWANQGRFSFMNFDVENVEKDVPFTFLHNILSFPAGFQGLVGVALVDANDNIKQILRYRDINTYSEADGEYVLTGQGLGFSDVKATVDVSDTDRLQLVAKKNDDEWKLIAGTIEAPAQASVTGNNADFVTCTYDFDPNIEASLIFDPSNKRIDIPTAGTIKVLAGTKMTVWARKADRESEGLIEIFTHDSNIIDGNLELSDENEVGYAWLLSDDIYVNGVLRTLGQVALEVTAGNLETLISKEDAEFVKELTLRGTMNVFDFRYLQVNFKYLESIDMSNVRIIGAEEQGFFTVQHKDDYLPEYALWQMPRLSRITLPQGLKGIGQYSMASLKLVDIIIPQGVQEIGNYALSANYSLENVVLINPQLVSIESNVFDFTHFEDKCALFVPEGRKEIYSGSDVWKDFEQIVQTDHAEEFLTPVLKDGIIYKLHGEIAKVQGYDTPADNVVLQDILNIDGHQCPVKEIGANAFENSQIKSIVIPNTVTEIGASAFNRAYNLESVILSKNITKIPYYAFYQCTSLCQLENTEQIQELEGVVLFGVPHSKHSKSKSRCVHPTFWSLHLQR